MNAEYGSGSRVRPWCWVLLLALIVSVSISSAQAGAPQKRSGAIAPFQCWLGIVGKGPATITQDAVSFCKDFADPGTLQVPTHLAAPVTRNNAKARVNHARLMPEQMTHMIGTAGCLMLPGWRLRLTTLSLLAR